MIRKLMFLWMKECSFLTLLSFAQRHDIDCDIKMIVDKLVTVYYYYCQRKNVITFVLHYTRYEEITTQKLQQFSIL